MALGQTIALDFQDGWWKSWWRRTRGYKAFAQTFQALISAETEDFMTQLKVVQAGEVRAAASRALSDYLDEQRDILQEMATRTDTPANMQQLFFDKDEVARRETLQTALDTFTRYAA